MYSMYINLRVLGDIRDQLLDLANLEGRDLLNIAQVLHNEFRPTIEVFWKPALFILSSSRLAHQIAIEWTCTANCGVKYKCRATCAEYYSARSLTTHTKPTAKCATKTTAKCAYSRWSTYIFRRLLLCRCHSQLRKWPFDDFFFLFPPFFPWNFFRLALIIIIHTLKSAFTQRTNPIPPFQYDSRIHTDTNPILTILT